MYERMGFIRVQEFEQYGRRYWIYAPYIRSYWAAGA
jgi:hypothetical protein